MPTETAELSSPLQSSDEGLLDTFASTRSDRAFRALVEKHLGLVLGVAMRRTGDRSAAEEIAQNVFTILARKAPRLKSGRALVAWIHRATLIECAETMRSRALHQNKMNAISRQLVTEFGGRDVWREVLPLLDDGIAALGRADREIILLRFFQRKSFREIGVALGKSDDAAQKQTERALSKLSEFLKRRGMIVRAAALGAGLGSLPAHAAPAGLAQSIAHSALATASALGSKILILKALQAMTNTKLKTAALATAIVAVPVAMQWHENARLREALRASEQQRNAVSSGMPTGAVDAEPTSLQAPSTGLARATAFPDPLDDATNVDPATAGREWEHALFIADPIQRNREITRLLATLTPTNAPLAVKGFERAKNSGIKFAEEERLFLRAWGKVGGQAAIEYAIAHGGGESSEAVAALGGWASVAPRVAQAWIEAQPESPAKDALMYGLLDGWSTFDFQAAAAYAESRPGGPARDSFRELLLQRALRSGGISAAQNWVMRIPEDDKNSDYKQRAFGDVIQAMLYRDPAAAARWISELGGQAFVGAEAVTHTAGKLAESSPTNALRWMTSLSSTDRQGIAQGAGTVLQNWAQKDVRAAGTWLGQNLNHPFYDQMTASYVRSILAKDQAAAQEWAGTIRDEGIRANALATRQSDYDSFIRMAMVDNRDVSYELIRWITNRESINSDILSTPTPSANPHGGETRWKNCASCHK